jgi:hypothetical protein
MEGRGQGWRQVYDGQNPSKRGGKYGGGRGGRWEKALGLGGQ